MERSQRGNSPRFQPMVGTNAFEVLNLMSMKQARTVREYRGKFKIVSGHVKIQNQELFLGMFSNGLMEDIRAEVRLQRPKDLAEVMDVALLAEEKIGAVVRTSKPRRVVAMWVSNRRTENQIKASTEGAPPSKGLELGKGGKLGGAKSLSSEEINERRRKGICFTCEEKFAPSHMCINKILKPLFVEEATEKEGESEKQE